MAGMTNTQLKFFKTTIHEVKQDKINQINRKCETECSNLDNPYKLLNDYAIKNKEEVQKRLYSALLDITQKGTSDPEWAQDATIDVFSNWSYLDSVQDKNIFQKESVDVFRKNKDKINKKYQVLIDRVCAEASKLIEEAVFADAPKDLMKALENFRKKEFK